MGKAGPGLVWINIKLLEPSAGEQQRVVGMRLWETSCLLGHMVELRAQPCSANSTALLIRIDILTLVGALLTEQLCPFKHNAHFLAGLGGQQVLT